MTMQQHSAYVSVHLTDCSPLDADAVFDILAAAFPADVDRETATHCEQLPDVANPMVWIRTYDVRTAGRAPKPVSLHGEVTADLFGCHRPVRELEAVLSRAFSTVEEGHVVPGDQEVQVRLGLTSRVPVPS
ncbi:hypothetical protein ACH429_20215 [Streptomyces pathocidini]|uniref:Uncharacterized protein n=1 Tax=Streptomyces pathocidini TaxID=1650571 RepID=A0ABW7UUY6_9ACTN|nr:hypothetical protein [Streptomyces pathocidini]